MAIYRCEVCNYEFDEEKEKKRKFSDLKKCPSCGADKKKMKHARDFLDEAVEGLHKYREGTPQSELEVED